MRQTLVLSSTVFHVPSRKRAMRLGIGVSPDGSRSWPSQITVLSVEFVPGLVKILRRGARAGVRLCSPGPLIPDWGQPGSEHRSRRGAAENLPPRVDGEGCAYDLRRRRA